MKTTEIITKLEKKINFYVYNRYLFAGGCCFSAFVLARALKMLGIDYKVVIYQYNQILKCTTFDEVVSFNGRGCAHVGIKVKCEGKEKIIGDCSRINAYFRNTGEKYIVKTYDGVEPKEILDFYHSCGWNRTWDKHCNGLVSRSINLIVKQYEDISL